MINLDNMSFSETEEFNSLSSYDASYNPFENEEFKDVIKSDNETINALTNTYDKATNVLYKDKNMNIEQKDKQTKNRDYSIFNDDDINNKFFYVNTCVSRTIKSCNKHEIINKIGNYIKNSINKYSVYEVLFKHQLVKLYFDIDKPITKEQLKTFVDIARCYNSGVSISGYITNKDVYNVIHETLVALHNSYNKLYYFINYKEPQDILNNNKINTLSLHIVYCDTCFDYSTFCKKKQRIIMKDEYKNIQDVIDHSVYNDGRLFRHICCDKIIVNKQGDNKRVKQDDNAVSNVSINMLYKQQLIQRLDITDKNKVTLNNIRDIMDIVTNDKNVVNTTQGTKATNVNDHMMTPADYTIRGYIKELLEEFCYDTTNKGLYKTLTNFIPYNELTMYGTNNFMDMYMSIYNSRKHKTEDNITEIFTKLSSCHYDKVKQHDNKARGLCYCLTYLKTSIVNKYYRSNDKEHRKMFKKSLLFYSNNDMLKLIRTMDAQGTNDEKSAYDYYDDLAQVTEEYLMGNATNVCDIKHTLQYKITILNEIIKYYILRYNINKSKANAYKASNKFMNININGFTDTSKSIFYKELYLTKILFNFNNSCLYIRNINDIEICKYSDRDFINELSLFVGHDIDIKQYMYILKTIYHVDNPLYKDSYNTLKLDYLDEEPMSDEVLATNVVEFLDGKKDHEISKLFVNTYGNNISRLYEDFENYMFLYSHENIDKGRFIKELLYTDIFNKFTIPYQYIRLYYGDGSNLKTSEYKLYENIIDNKNHALKADKEDMFSQFNGIYKLAKFLLIEEVPDAYHDLTKFINKLKDLCQHGETTINMKYKNAFKAYSSTRLMLNTNHEELIDKLLYNKDTSILKRFVIAHRIKPVIDETGLFTQLFGALTRYKPFCKEYAKWVYAKKDTYKFMYNINNENELIKLNNVSKEVKQSEEDNKYNFLKCIDKNNTTHVYLNKNDFDNRRFVYRIAVKDVYNMFCKYLSENNVKAIKYPMFLKNYVNKYVNKKKHCYISTGKRIDSEIYYVEELIELREEDKTIYDINNNIYYD